MSSGVPSSGAGRSQSTHLRDMVGGRPSDNDYCITGSEKRNENKEWLSGDSL